MDKHLKKYFALLIIIVLGLSIIYMLKGFLTPIFAALILSFLLYPIYKIIFGKVKNEIGSALIVIISLIVLLLIPLSAVAGVLLGEINNFDLKDDKLNSYETNLKAFTGKDLAVKENVLKVETWIKDEAKAILPKLVSITSNFMLSLFIMCFIIFYLLIQKEFFLKEFISLMPFSNEGSMTLLNESGNIARAVVIGQVITAFIQGLLGMFAFVLVGIESAFFWGIIMMILSLIPVVGAFLIWLPAGLFLLLEGFIWQGVFVLVWGAIVVSQADNLIRPKLVNKFANIHPIETFLGIFMGIATFGLIGIIVGPLFISLFKLVVMTYRDEY